MQVGQSHPLRPSTCWASLNRPCARAAIELIRATRHYYLWCHKNHGPWTDWHIPPPLRSRLREPQKHWHYMKNRRMQWRCIGSIETLPLHHLLYGELTASRTGRQGLSIRFTSICGPHLFCLHLKVLNVLRNRVDVLTWDNGPKPRCGPSLQLRQPTTTLTTHAFLWFYAAWSSLLLLTSSISQRFVNHILCWLASEG